MHAYSIQQQYHVFTTTTTDHDDDHVDDEDYHDHHSLTHFFSLPGNYHHHHRHHTLFNIIILKLSTFTVPLPTHHCLLCLFNFLWIILLLLSLCFSLDMAFKKSNLFILDKQLKEWKKFFLMFPGIDGVYYGEYSSSSSRISIMLSYWSFRRRRKNTMQRWLSWCLVIFVVCAHDVSLHKQNLNPFFFSLIFPFPSLTVIIIQALNWKGEKFFWIFKSSAALIIMGNKIAYLASVHLLSFFLLLCYHIPEK